MKLKQFKLKNFRGYKDLTSINIDDLNVLIGKNDVGKSTILEGLDIFFNGKPDKDDLSVSHDNSTIELICVFSDLPNEIILDETNPTNLKNEFLLNAEGNLEIIKRFPISDSGSVSEEAFVKCLSPDHESLDNLLSKKKTTLSLLFQDLRINDEGVDQRKSKELRNAIRRYFFPEGDIPTKNHEIKIDGKLDNEDNRKKIWSSLKKYLPLYSLFFVDKPLNDQDSDIQDPMKDIIKEVLKRDAIIPLLETLKEEVQRASTSMADQTIKKLNELDSKLAETLRSNFPKEPSWSGIFKLTLEDDRGIPLNKRGSGMRRLVLLSFFRAQIENRTSSSAPNIIYALEEPETSQHPDFQLMIVKALKELSETENAQVLFTTHNSNLAKEIPKKALRYVFKEDGVTKTESGVNRDGTDNPEIIDKIIETLGSLPDPKNKVKLLIFVEGEKDINALINYNRILHDNDVSIPLLENNEAVAFIPTGGSQLKFYIEKKYLDGLTQSQIHIYDSDIPSYVELVRNMNAENNPNKTGFNTTKLEMENFLHHEAIIEAYSENNIQIQLNPIQDNDDVPFLVAKAVHEATSETAWDEMNPVGEKKNEKQGKKISKAKHLLNNGAILKMSIDRLSERGGLEELNEWMLKISEKIDE
jgi:putative ATP-dependent endonuclease of the OLD family